jgi:hypothetical protein
MTLPPKVKNALIAPTARASNALGRRHPQPLHGEQAM